MSYITLFISLALISNVVLSRFLGICPLLGVSKSAKNALSMGAAVTFVVFIAAVVTYGLYYLVLVPAEITYMDLITFILVIAALVQFVEMFLKKYSPAIYKAMGVYLPLITTNCCVLGCALDNITNEYNFAEACIAGLAVPLGFALVIYIFANIRERLAIYNAPKAFQGVPLALITAGIMACAFAGLGGLV